jgi:probable addiction module antidote protein
MKKFEKFDAARYLGSETAIAEFLTAALEDENPQVFVAALGAVAKARGMAQIAKDAGLGRESLYKALAPDSKLRYATVHKLLTSLGLKLSATAEH